MYYLRKIDPELWDGKENLDAVSIGNLSTKDNNISVWQIGDRNELEEVGLTIAMTRDSLKDVNVVIMEEDEIRKLGLEVTSQSGMSRFAEKNDSHKNISVPTFWEIGYLSEYIYERLKDEENFHYFAEEELKETLYKVVKEGSMDYRFMADKSEKKLRNTLIAICSEKEDDELKKALERIASNKTL